MRKAILEAAFASGEGHVPSAFSVLDILWVLYDKVLRCDPADPSARDRDRFILSKGHASLGLYAVLAEKGYFPAALLRDFARYGNPLGGHPDCTKVPGVEASTGSLGHGFPMGVGAALGLRLRKSDARVYVLIGDGECNEGAVWEAALLAAHHGLSNLCCIVDDNRSTDRALGVGDLVSKFASFGWKASRIDGHDHTRILEALVERPDGRPVAVVADTVKGRGCRRMENDPAWHHRSPNREELEEMLGEIG